MFPFCICYKIITLLVIVFINFPHLQVVFFCFFPQCMSVQTWVCLWSFVAGAEAIDLYPQGSFQPSGLLCIVALVADEPPWAHWLPRQSQAVQASCPGSIQAFKAKNRALRQTHTFLGELSQPPGKEKPQIPVQITPKLSKIWCLLMIRKEQLMLLKLLKSYQMHL